MLIVSRLKRATFISFLFIFVVCLGRFGSTRLATHAASPTSTTSKVAATCGSWNVISSPNPGVGNESLFGVAAVSSNDVWTVGNTQNNGVGNPQTLTEHWDGTSWSVVPSPNPGLIYNYLNGVTATSATNVWAVGGYLSSGNMVILTEHWNGKHWKVIASPNVGTQGGLLNAATQVPGTNQVWATGNPQTLIEHWDGISWSVVASPNPGLENELLGMTAVSVKNVWAVGDYLPNSSNYHQTLIEHWNGISWSVVSSPSVGTSFNYLKGVTRVPGTKQVWTVGYYNAGSYTQTLIEFYC